MDDRPADIHIRAAQPADLAAWLDLRRKLWPETSLEEHEAEQLQITADLRRFGVMVAADEQSLVGFVEVSLHDRADGCHTSPVGYIEGWFVDEPARRLGIGGRLIKAAEQWALASGCREMASDARLENHVSIAAHNSLGYASIGAVMRFAKPLPADEFSNE